MVAWNNFGPVSIFDPTSKSDLLLSRRRGRPRADLRTAGANGAADTPSGGRVGRGKVSGRIFQPQPGKTNLPCATLSC